jgi:nucleotide-binding universal stress UspA family protein
MKTIIVPTDFSAVSINAANYAIDMALSIDADILLLHVAPLPVIVADVPIPLTNDPYPFMSAEEDLEKMKKDLEKRSNNLVPITCQLRTGNFLQEMKNLNKEKAPFAFIMGSKGAGTTETFFMGSFVRTAIAGLKAPIIVVPPGAVFQTIKKIGLACDMKNVIYLRPLKQNSRFCISAILKKTSPLKY